MKPVKLVNRQYLDKFRWSAPEIVPTIYGKRQKQWTRVGGYERQLYLDNKPKFDGLGVTMSQSKKDPNIWFYLRWSTPPREAADQQSKSVHLSKALHATIDIPAPDGLEYYPYQKAAIEYMLNRKGTLVGDDMGLGKTPEAIGFINAHNHRAGKRTLQRILIICPADLRLNWREELNRWLVDDYSIDIAQKGVFPSTDIVIVSHESLAKWDKEVTFYWCLVIIDECDYYSNPKSKATKALCGYIPNREEAKRGEVIRASLPAKIKVAMTGTPIRNRPKNIFSIINYLAPTLWPNRNQFIARYCGGHLPDGRWTSDGATNQEELYEQLRKTVMVRREKKDVLLDLPPKRRSVCVIPVDPKYAHKLGELGADWKMKAWMERVAQAKARMEIAKCVSPLSYRAAADELEKAMDSGASATFELFHAIGLAKVEAALEIFRRAVLVTPKIMIVAHHDDVMTKVVEGLPGCMRISGGVTHAERHEIVRLFQSSPTSGPLVIQIDCAKGITLTAASDSYFLEGSWLPGKILQAEDRQYRIGQKNCVNVTHLVLAGSIDIVRANAVIQKQADIDRIMNIDTERKDEMEREPVVPMPWVTLSLKTIADRALQIGHQSESIRLRCEEYLRSGVPSEANKLMLQMMGNQAWSPRLAVLGEEILKAATQIRVASPVPSISLPANVPPVRSYTSNQAELTFVR